MGLLAEDCVARDNLAREDELNRQMLSLESQTIAWMGSATALYNAVETADQAHVLALRDLLIAKLTAAVAL